MDPKQQLRSSGLHVTAQRLAILRAVGSHPHATAEDILEVVRAEIGAISKQAVYDGLSVMSDKRLICRGCSLMFDIDCAVGYTPCLTADHDHGFVIDEAEVVYWGYCAACVSERDPARAPS